LHAARLRPTVANTQNSRPGVKTDENASSSVRRAGFHNLLILG
jgi:hypothetical protein